MSWWFICTGVVQVKALGCDGSTSLSSWLDVLGLQEYLHNFMSSGYRTLECVKNLWELEIVNVRTTSYIHTFTVISKDCSFLSLFLYNVSVTLLTRLRLLNYIS